MGWRRVGMIILISGMAAGAYWGRSFLPGYPGARREPVPNPPVQAVSKPPGSQITSTPGGGRRAKSSATTQPRFQTKPPNGTNDPPPENGVPSTKSGAFSGESRIDTYYLAKLAAIGSYYQSQLDTLLAQAYSSYRAVRAGHSNESLLSLAGQYMTKGEALERRSDQAFNSELDQYRAALEKAGLPLTYLERAKTDYETAKAAERQKILAAAEQYLK